MFVMDPCGYIFSPVFVSHVYTCGIVSPTRITRKGGVPNNDLCMWCHRFQSTL